MTCNACNQGYEPMGAYQPEIIMNATGLVGYEKDGSPVYVSMASQTDPVNLLGTVAFIAAGASLGWLLTGAVIGYLK